MKHNNPSGYELRMHESRQLWNSEAAAFDKQPDHGLRDPVVLAAWTNLLRVLLMPGKAAILDIGCGTGSLSLVLDKLGYDVTGIDFSPEMISLAEAKAKAADHPINFQIMDAVFPQFPPRQFDAIVSRHLLWALPEPENVLQRWVHLLKPGGRLVLIEGCWHTAAGLHAETIVNLLPPSMINIGVHNLSAQTDLWGSEVRDERYAIVATQP